MMRRLGRLCGYRMTPRPKVTPVSIVRIDDGTSSSRASELSNVDCRHDVAELVRNHRSQLQPVNEFPLSFGIRTGFGIRTTGGSDWAMSAAEILPRVSRFHWISTDAAASKPTVTTISAA